MHPRPPQEVVEVTACSTHMRGSKTCEAGQCKPLSRKVLSTLFHMHEHTGASDYLDKDFLLLYHQGTDTNM